MNSNLLASPIQTFFLPLLFVSEIVCFDRDRDGEFCSFGSTTKLKGDSCIHQAQKFPTTSLSFYDRASSTYFKHSSPRNVQDVCHMNLV